MLRFGQRERDSVCLFVCLFVCFFRNWDFETVGLLEEGIGKDGMGAVMGSRL